MAAAPSPWAPLITARFVLAIASAKALRQRREVGGEVRAVVVVEIVVEADHRNLAEVSFLVSLRRALAAGLGLEGWYP